VLALSIPHVLWFYRVPTGGFVTIPLRVEKRFLSGSGIKIPETGSSVFACEKRHGSVKNFRLAGGKIGKFDVGFCDVQACFGLIRVAQTAGYSFLS